MFWPAGFDPRADGARILSLCEIDAPSGLARFLIGQDGVFRDIDGNPWVGSQAIEVGDVEISRDGKAPSLSIGLTWFQDPDAPDLIDEIKASGDAAITEALVHFYVQPIRSQEELYAPAFAPVLLATRVATAVTFQYPDALTRKITLTLETAYATRRRRMSAFHTPEFYQRFLGFPSPRNPSLDFMPIKPPEASLIT